MQSIITAESVLITGTFASGVQSMKREQLGWKGCIHSLKPFRLYGGVNVDKHPQIPLSTITKRNWFYMPLNT